MDYEQHTRDGFAAGLNCAQIVLAAFAPRLGMDADLARCLAAGLGGGVARMGGTCGAVAGSHLVLGLRFGSGDGDSVAKEATYARIRELHRRFTAAHGSTVCRDLLGFDLGDDRQYQEVVQRGLFSSICPRLVAGAVALLEELITEAE